jgi:ribonuclease G
LRWFRRVFSRTEDTQRAEEPARDLEVAPTDAHAPEDEGAAENESEAERKKRRRGKRGGRSRSRASAEARAADEEPKQETAQPERKPARQQSQRQEKRANEKRQPGRRRLQPRRAALPEAKRELLVSVDVGEQRVAVLEDGRVAEVYVERPERRSIAGNIYLGVVDNVLPGMEAAFVEIGLEKNGFLYVDEIVVPELEGKRHGKRIQDLLQRGQEVLVQAVKDPMGSKGARLTTEISLPGRFVVFVPHGEGLGVSRRLPDEERQRLKEIIKALDVKQGGVIVRTAADGASADDVERDLVFLQKLWKTIEERAKQVKPPTLIYQEPELPLRVVRDLFTGDFVSAQVDDDRTMKRVVGYLKKTSPHMVERVHRHKEKTPLMETFGVEAEIRSTLSRRVDLPSGGYLIFDYAEAFTVIDVNTGRFVGSRSKSSGGRLEDTITKNNLEAVKEVVRQLRLRDIGGIIVIDFIDMANPKNRATVEEALRQELQRDRTKTYVVEISPLGLVEMTRQNVTDGPREILTKKCPTCGGDGIVLSEASTAVDVERRLRALAAGSPRTQAFRVEVNAKVASILIGPGASRLKELEALARRRFFVEAKDDVHLDHFGVVAQGKLEALAPEAPVEEGQELEVKLVEVGLHDVTAAVAKVDGHDICVAGAAKLVGKKVKVRIERVLDGTAYAARVDAAAAAPAPITAEGEAEKPTRPARKKPAAKPEQAAADKRPLEEEEAAADLEEAEPAAAEASTDGDGAAEPKKRTRRGSRGGRRRKKTVGADGTSADDSAEASETEPQTDVAEDAEQPEPVAAGNGSGDAEAVAAPRIHVPPDHLGERDEAESVPAQLGDDGAVPAVDADEAEKPKKKTRRGSRGGRNRKKKAPTAIGGGSASGADMAAEVEAAAAPAVEEDAVAADSAAEDGGESGAADAYVPMSEWAEDFDR